MITLRGPPLYILLKRLYALTNFDQVLLCFTDILLSHRQRHSPHGYQHPDHSPDHQSQFTQTPLHGLASLGH